jgi:tetratricopeptide (TPR) repeat protein
LALHLKAIKDFDKAIALDSNYGYAYLNRGIAKELIRDHSGACIDWEKAKELGVKNGKIFFEQDCNK